MDNTILNPAYKAPTRGEAIPSKDFLARAVQTNDDLANIPQSHDMLMGIIIGSMLGSKYPEETRFIFEELVDALGVDQLAKVERQVRFIMRDGQNGYKLNRGLTI